MKNKIATLKEIRRQSHDLNPRSEDFDKKIESLSREALDCMEGVNDMQEKKWLEKSLEIVSKSGKNTLEAQDKDRALSYLKEAVHTVILREENYRE